MKFQTIKKSAVALIAVSLICKLFGMVRDIVLAKYYGTSAISDAYLIAFSVPTLIFRFVGYSIGTAYLPMYNQIKKEKGVGKALDYTNNLSCIAIAVVAVLVAALLIFTEPILRLFAPGFDVQTMALTVRFVRISAASLFFMTLVSIWTGYLQANQNFVIPGSVSLVRNAVIIASIVIAPRFGLDFLGLGMLLAFVAEFLMLLVASLRASYRPKVIFQLKDEEVKQTLYLILPILLGVAVSQINKVVDRSIASTMVTGGVSALSYAGVLNIAVQEVLVTGIITILFAHCAELVAQQKHDEVKRKLSSTIDATSFLMIPATAGVIILAKEIVTNILCRGSFDAESVRLTTGALQCYSAGLAFMSVREILIKLFYAYRDTKTTTVTSVAAIALNIGLNFLLSRWFGISGLAAATSIATATQCIALYFLLRKKIGNFGTKATGIVLLKSLTATAVMSGLLILLRRWNVFSSLPPLIVLILYIILGAICYMACAVILRIRPLTELLEKLFHKIRS